MKDLTIIYYTSNWLEKANPYFLENTRKQMLKAAGDLPFVIVSHKPVDWPEWKKSGIPRTEGRNIVLEGWTRSHLNIYRQILIGAKAANTKYVAMAEDDILYSHNHFHSEQIERDFKNHGDVFLYDMNKLSLFTWTNPPMFSFRSKRMVVNQLIAPRDMLVEALEERFARLEVLKKQGKKEEKIIKYWGDPGRYEGLLGVTTRPCIKFYSNSPSIVFTHEHAFGYLNHGKRKRLGDIRIIELYDWGRAEEVLKLYYEK